MKKIIAFAGSNSKNSINKQLIEYTLGLVDNLGVNILDLNDYELPLFGIDYENQHGIPENAHKFLNEIKTSNGIILSLAEHNGAYSTVFKNLFDWMSRIEGETFCGKPMLLMATSPGGRGGASVLEIAKGRFPYHKAKITDTFSLPFFSKNFVDGKIIDQQLKEELKSKVKSFQETL